MSTFQKTSILSQITETSYELCICCITKHQVIIKSIFRFVLPTSHYVFKMIAGFPRNCAYQMDPQATNIIIGKYIHTDIPPNTAKAIAIIR